MANVVRKVFIGSGTFTPPGGVYRCRVYAENDLTKIVSGKVDTRYAIDNQGNLYAWGNNSIGQLGDGTQVSKSSPVLVVGSHSFAQVFSNGNDGVYAIDTQGAMWVWGFNGGPGILGNNSTGTNHSTPVAITTNVRYQKVYGISQTSQLMVALGSDGTIYCWGLNGAGQLGDGSLIPKSSPVAVLGSHVFTQFDCSVNSSTLGSVVALDSAGAAWAWGMNGSGMLGDGTSAAKSSPVAVIGGLTFQKIATTTAQNGNFGSCIALDLNGNAYCWGYGVTGCIGNGAALSVSSPVAVVGGKKFKDVFASYDAMYGLDFAGALWAWGANDQGQLGDGTNFNRSSPVAVVGGVVFSKIFEKTQDQTMYGLDVAGQLWGWGLGSYLGDGTLVGKSSPVAIAASLKLQNVGPRGGGISVDPNGNIYTWGANNTGQLGNGNTTATSSPVPVVGPTIFVAPVQKAAAISFEVTPGIGYAILMQKYYAWFNGVQIGVMANRVVVEYEQ